MTDTIRLQNQWPGVRILPLLPKFKAKPGPYGPGFIFGFPFCRHFFLILSWKGVDFSGFWFGGTISGATFYTSN